MSEPKKGLEFIKAFALLSQLGLSIALPIFGGFLLGRYLDNRLDSGGTWTVILILLGLFGGLGSGYGLIMTTINRGEGLKKDKKNQNKKQPEDREKDP